MCSISVLKKDKSFAGYFVESKMLPENMLKREICVFIQGSGVTCRYNFQEALCEEGCW